ncbi:MAG TPA: hypothetical protein VF862_13310 [Gemmatimonadales bacterium]
MHCRSRWTFPLALLAAAACSDLATDVTDPLAPSLRPGPAGPTYTVLTPPLAPGYTALVPTDINVLHQAIGYVNPEGSTSQSARLAAVWHAGSGAAPQLLPGGTGTTARGISDNGIIAGVVFPAAVLWKPAGSSWDLVVLNEVAEAMDVREDGSAVGIAFDPQYPSFRDDAQPVAWDADGVMTRLPMPASGQWTGGEAYAINAQGDIAGTFEERPSPGWALVYGALWVREGAGYIPIVMQTGGANGLSDRTADGRIIVTASDLRFAYRHTFTRNPATGAWTSDSVYVGGSAADVNARGDFVGTIPKGTYSSAGYPFLFTAEGTLLKLPIPKGSTGTAGGLSTDGWITGSIGGTGVVWKPGQ